MQTISLLQLFKEHFDAIAIFATFVVGYFQLRKMMREEVKHIADPIKETLESHNKRFEAIDRKWEAIDRKWEAIDRKWEANELRWQEMRNESRAILEKIHQLQLQQAQKNPQS